MNHIVKHIKTLLIILVLFSCQATGNKEKEQVVAIKKDSILPCCQNLPSRFGIPKKKDSTVQAVKPQQK